MSSSNEIGLEIGVARCRGPHPDFLFWLPNPDEPKISALPIALPKGVTYTSFWFLQDLFYVLLARLLCI
jgi:hypothetical protein